MNESFFALSAKLILISDQYPNFVMVQFIRISAVPDANAQLVGKFEIDLMVRILVLHFPVIFFSFVFAVKYLKSGFPAGSSSHGAVPRRG